MGEEFSLQPDEYIARLIQSGKIEFFSILLERYEAKMRRYAQKFLNDREDINDVLQDIFIKAYKNIQSFDSKRKFSPWLYRIAHNELVNVLKKKNHLPLRFDFDVFLPHPFAGKNDPEQEFSQRQIAETIDKCLDNLEPKYKEPVILYYFENLSYQEIADVLQIPASTLGIRLKRAKEKMKKFIGRLKV